MQFTTALLSVVAAASTANADSLQYFIESGADVSFASGCGRECPTGNTNIIGVHLHKGGATVNGPPPILICGAAPIPAVLRTYTKYDTGEVMPLPFCKSTNAQYGSPTFTAKLDGGYGYSKFGKDTAAPNITPDEFEKALIACFEDPRKVCDVYYNIHTEASLANTGGLGLARGQLKKTECPSGTHSQVMCFTADVNSHNTNAVLPADDVQYAKDSKVTGLMILAYPTSVSVEISAEVKFDQYPGEITWTLENTCYGGSKVLKEGGPYPASLAGKTATGFNITTSDGSFKFTINDSFGDGLCCSVGSGGYAITYKAIDGRAEKIVSDFKQKSQEIREFGMDAYCPPVTPVPPVYSKAAYDSALGVPKCGSVDPSGSCTTVGTGLFDCKKVSGEPHGPNTLDTCTDGINGVCGTDESIQDITVMSVGPGMKMPDGPLKAGGKAMVHADIISYGTGSEDQVDFFHSSNPGPNPNWNFIGSVRPAAGGKVGVKSPEFVLDSSSKMQAVRVNLRWVGTAIVPHESCSGEEYNDVDDLVFVV